MYLLTFEHLKKNIFYFYWKLYKFKKKLQYFFYLRNYYEHMKVTVLL